MRTICVLPVRVNDDPLACEPVRIPDTLQAYYDLIDCSVLELVKVPLLCRGKREVYIACDEEGKLNRKPVNCAAPFNTDFIVGDIFLIAFDGSTGCPTSLTGWEVKNGQRYISHMRECLREWW